MIEQAVTTAHFERASTVWLTEGPTAAPPSAVEDILFEIDSVAQPRAWARWRPAGPELAWSAVPQHAVAVVAGGIGVVVLALTAFAPGGFMSFSAAEATPGPTPTATAAPVDIGIGLVARTIGPGTYRSELTPGVTFTVPEDMQLRVRRGSVEALPLDDARHGHDGLGGVRNGIDILVAYRKWDDVCEPERGFHSRTPQSVNDVIAWLRQQQRSVEVSADVSTTVGGWPATRVQAIGFDCFSSGAGPLLSPQRRAFAFYPALNHRVYLVQLADRSVAIDVFAVQQGNEWFEVADQLIASLVFDP